MTQQRRPSHQTELVANHVLVPASLVELAGQRLRSEILSGVLVPGERLIEEQLTRRFGTSSAPRREALRLLLGRTRWAVVVAVIPNVASWVGRRVGAVSVMRAR